MAVLPNRTLAIGGEQLLEGRDSLPLVGLVQRDMAGRGKYDRRDAS